jgi:hypothetical protein
MNLACTQCGSEDTKKISLLMNEGGVREKGAQLGAAHFYNYGIPVATLFFAVMLGFLFALFNWVVGVIAFAGTLYAGSRVRKYVKNKTRSPFADIPEDIKRDGFRCNRCEHMFIPARGLGT